MSAKVSRRSTDVILELEDGSRYQGRSFGGEAVVAGEVVFNTAMAGYVESLTDPSYRGQILALTYPLVGNYGVPGPEQPAASMDRSSPAISRRAAWWCSPIRGHPSHPASRRTLGQWLLSEGIPGLTGIDTRALTLRLREQGTMSGVLFPADMDSKSAWATARRVEMTRQVFHDVAPTETVTYAGGPTRIVLVDCGAKDQIVRSLLRRGATVVRIPWHSDATSCLSSGRRAADWKWPGRPCRSRQVVQRRSSDSRHLPGSGIRRLPRHTRSWRSPRRCDTYKLPYGHRGVNQPVQDLSTRRCFVTSQNHGYAVRRRTLPADWEPWFVNINDGTNEGIRARQGRIFSVQFHPEASPGPAGHGVPVRRLPATVRRDSRRSADDAPPVQPSEAAARVAGARLRRAADRPGRRVRLFRLAGDQGAAGRGHLHRSRQPEHRDHPDQRRARRSRLPPRRSRRSSSNEIIGEEGVDAILLRSAARPRSTAASRSTSAGVFDELGVRVLGTPVAAIRDTEDRQLFVERLDEIGVKTARSTRLPHRRRRRAARSQEIGLPVMLRGGFALGGKGSGIVDDAEATRRVRSRARSPAAFSRCWSRSACAAGRRSSTRSSATAATTASPSATWRTSIRWASTPGESIVVAPSQTLNDDEYQMLRTIAIKTMRHLGIVGECNIQYALDPGVERLPRDRGQCAPVALQSALASKATGYPLAYVAAKIALGYALPEIPNGITRQDHRVLRAGARLHRLQGAALGPRRSSSGASTQHRQRDEERRRGHGHRPHVPGGAAEGAAHARHRRARPRPGRVSSSTTSSDQLRQCDAAAASSPSRGRCATA